MTHSSASTPTVIAMSATLNAGQCGQLDEVGDRAVAHAVDDVAERAAEQHAGRQPDQRRVGVAREVDEQRQHERSGDHDAMHDRAPPPQEAERDAAGCAR